MEKEGTAVEYSGKRTMELEVVIKWLKEENRSLIAGIEVLEKQYLDESREKADQIHKLKQEVVAVKGIEEMWSKAEEKCKVLEVENGRLEMDIEAAESENNALHKALEQDWLDKVIQVGFKLEREILEEKKRVLDEKMSMEAKEKKMTELVQRNKVLEKENVTIKQKGEEKILELGHRIDILERERRRLEEEYTQRIDVINVLVQEKECLDAKLKKLKMEINTWAVNVKLEDNADLPQNNVCILGNAARNQGKRKQSLLENSSGGDGSTGSSSTAKRARPSI